MFTFNHVTSIGISEEEYSRRLAAGETGLVKSETKFYREIETSVTVPVSVDDACEYIRSDKATDDVKLGDKKFTLPQSVKDLIVGIKLAVNQKVQAANRDGNGGPSNLEIVQSVLRSAEQGSNDFLSAAGALVSQRTVKAFATRWMAEHPDWQVTK